MLTTFLTVSAIFESNLEFERLPTCTRRQIPIESPSIDVEKDLFVEL
jgi:hypothetical protein